MNTKKTMLMLIATLLLLSGCASKTDKDESPESVDKGGQIANEDNGDASNGKESGKDDAPDANECVCEPEIVEKEVIKEVIVEKVVLIDSADYYIGYVVKPDVGLNVRSKPDKNASKLGLLEEGVLIYGAPDLYGWVEFIYKGNLGYVFAEYLRVPSYNEYYR